MHTHQQSWNLTEYQKLDKMGHDVMINQALAKELCCMVLRRTHIIVVDVLKGIHCSNSAVDKQEFEAVSASFFKPL